MNIKTKIILIGTKGSGKSSLLYHCLDGTFLTDNPPTLGVNQRTLITNVADDEVETTIIDLAGIQNDGSYYCQDDFGTFSEFVKRFDNVNLELLCIDFNDLGDLNTTAIDCIHDYLNQCQNNTPKVIVFTKCDLAKDLENKCMQAYRTLREKFKEVEFRQYIKTSSKQNTASYCTTTMAFGFLSKKMQPVSIKAAMTYISLNMVGGIHIAETQQARNGIQFGEERVNFSSPFTVARKV